jgi:hypothetical protein
MNPDVQFNRSSCDQVGIKNGNTNKSNQLCVTIFAANLRARLPDNCAKFDQKAFAAKRDSVMRDDSRNQVIKLIDYGRSFVISPER